MIVLLKKQGSNLLYFVFRVFLLVFVISSINKFKNENTVLMLHLNKLFLENKLKHQVYSLYGNIKKSLN